MRRKIVLFVVLTSTITLLIVKYGFVLVLWFTTPKDGELQPSEKELFQRIQVDFKAKDVWREPKYNISNPDTAASYRVIVNRIPCTEDTTGLSLAAQDIFNQLKRLELGGAFLKKEVLFICEEGKEYRFYEMQDTLFLRSYK